jgi:hypothetical protein
MFIFGRGWTVLAAALAGIGLAVVCRAEGEDLARRVEALEREVRELSSGGGEEDAWDKVAIHGYGELHYNNLSGEGGAEDKDELDFHRFVLFFGYEFTESLRFNSELELEHAVAGEGEEHPGYLVLEQAFLDFDLNKRNTARAGIFLVPVGFLNETHEPSRFYGVERNRVENQILPTTWSEGGLGWIRNSEGGWTFSGYAHTGLQTSSNDYYAVRAGRQRVAEADASNPAATASIHWQGQGLLLGGAAHYQSDVTQGEDPTAGAAWLGEVHASWTGGPVTLKALVAEWSLDGSGPESLGADRQFGWYIEPSFRPIQSVGFFVRYGAWDNRSGDAGGESGKTQWDTGVNYWPIDQVVVKADYQWQDHEDGKNQSGFNLGLGYEF